MEDGIGFGWLGEKGSFLMPIDKLWAMLPPRSINTASFNRQT